MAEASASSASGLQPPMRGPGTHRVHSSCDRCRSRKTKVGPPTPPVINGQDTNETSVSIQVSRDPYRVFLVCCANVWGLTVHHEQSLDHVDTVLALGPSVR